MPERRIVQPPPPGIDHAELRFPEDTDISTGDLTVVVPSESLTRTDVTTVAFSHVPEFAIRVDVSTRTREIAVGVGRADGSPPSAAVFRLPRGIEASGTHTFQIAFADWVIVRVLADGSELQEIQALSTYQDPSLSVVQISPSLARHITPYDVIQAVGRLYFRLDLPEPGILFRVLCNSYYLEVGFTDTEFYITRNNDRLEMPIKQGATFFFACWQPTQLSLGSLTQSEVKLSDPAVCEANTQTCETGSVIPPYSLVDWARRQAIAPVVAYSSSDELCQVVIASLQAIADKVRSLGLQNAFWDKTYQERKVVTRRPKSEPDIQPTIHGLLHDICLAKNVQVSRESVVAGGELDFLFSGHLVTGQRASICTEFKHAHSEKLKDGLLKQLPAYMRAKGSDFGLYCVLYFKCAEFAEPNEFADAQELLFTLDVTRLNSGLTNIRILVLDLSYQVPPSRL